MGWANCGTDSRGRPIGYAHEATCDEPGCGAKLYRGLDYACGGMHGEDEWSCEDYFCHDHLECVSVSGLVLGVCARCKLALIESGAIDVECEECGNEVPLRDAIRIRALDVFLCGACE